MGLCAYDSFADSGDRLERYNVTTCIHCAVLVYVVNLEVTEAATYAVFLPRFAGCNNGINQNQTAFSILERERCAP